MRYEYEFKEYIRDEILSNINHMNILDDALEELDHVYTQATKADEYEAKAKAWDRVYEAFEKAENEHEFSNGVCTVMNEYERGGYDAKKRRSGLLHQMHG